MSGAHPSRAAFRPSSLPDLRTLLRGSETLDTLAGTGLQLCLLAALRPGEAVDARFGDVAWAQGLLLVNAGNRRREAVLSYAATAAILHSARSADPDGQLIGGGTGRRVTGSAMRSSALSRALAGVDSIAGDVRWTWPSVRSGIARALAIDGADGDAIACFIGKRPRRWHDRSGPERFAREVADTAERWAALLL